MKKIFIAVLVTVAIGSSAFAADVTRVSVKVKNSFESQFAGAEKVTWSSKDNFSKATFVIADQDVEAFFGMDGDLIAVSRKVDFKKLPLNAVQKIRKEYGAYAVTESIEFEQDGEKRYYVSLEDGAKKRILEVSLYGNISNYNGPKK